jgi:UDP-N-acetylmuramoyl-tripeptide--D-alanyl-D-alanine ligase
MMRNYIDERTILVEGLSALQELAKFHRKYLNLPIIALTGVMEKQRLKS